MMASRIQPERLRAMAFPRVFDAHKLIVGLVYLAAYALLDWISFIEPYAHFGITPWNPGTGLSFVLLLLFGLRMIPFLLVGPLLADLLNQQLPCPGRSRCCLRCWSAAAIRSRWRSCCVRRSFRSGAGVDARSRSADGGRGGERGLCRIGLCRPDGRRRAAAGAGLRRGDAALLGRRRHRHHGRRAVCAVRVDAPPHPADDDRNRCCNSSRSRWRWRWCSAWRRSSNSSCSTFCSCRSSGLRCAPARKASASAYWSRNSASSSAFSCFRRAAFDVTAFQALMLVLAMTGLVAGELVTERRRTESQLRLQQESAVASGAARQHGRTRRRGGARTQPALDGGRHLYAAGRTMR